MGRPCPERARCILFLRWKSFPLWTISNLQESTGIIWHLRAHPLESADVNILSYLLHISPWHEEENITVTAKMKLFNQECGWTLVPMSGFVPGSLQGLGTWMWLTELPGFFGLTGQWRRHPWEQTTIPRWDKCQSSGGAGERGLSEEVSWGIGILKLYLEKLSRSLLVWVRGNWLSRWREPQMQKHGGWKGMWAGVTMSRLCATSAWPVGRWGVASDSYGICSELPQTQKLPTTDIFNLSSGGWKSQIKKVAAFLLCLHMCPPTSLISLPCLIRTWPRWVRAPPKWVHFNLITFLKIICPKAYLLRYWGLKLQHMNWGREDTIQFSSR